MRARVARRLTDIRIVTAGGGERCRLLFFRGYAPARYVDTVEISRRWQAVLRTEGGISRFNFDAGTGERIEVRDADSDSAKLAGNSDPGGS